MIDKRPSPDELLAHMQAEEAGARRGKLKVFFGYVAGVGKTYAMLEAAQRERAAGVDVVVGYVEPHGRAETEALLEGLEVLPTRSIPYRGITLRELDLDAALARRPQLILVDELAHTNAEGSRHAKRWQDVEELLQAGTDVYSTLNVQHIESLNDVIAQITGVAVRETLPDAVLERADDIELIDITPEELIERLKAGKVYVPQQAERALQNFFHRANLTALRELSLRQAAQRLRRDVDTARQAKAATSPWATNERLLVCVGPSPTTARLLRTAKRMAAAFAADWLAAAVQIRPDVQGSPAVREQIAQHLRLAEQLGAEVHTLVGDNVADTIVEFARSRNVTKIVVGKTAQSWWKRLFFGTVVDRLLDRSGDIDVYVIRGEAEAPGPTPVPRQRAGVNWLHYLVTGLVVALCALAGCISHALEHPEANIVLVFLLGVAFVGYRFGRGPAIAAAIASVLVFDFFFVPPQLELTVKDWKYLVTFAVMLIIGVIISTLTARLKEQLHGAQQMERRTAALFRLTKQMSEVAGPEFLIRNAGQQLGEIFSGEVVILIRDASNQLMLRYGQDTTIAQFEMNLTVASWVADHDQMAGAGTDTLPSATALFVPLVGSQRNVGAVGVKPNDPERFSDPEQRRLLETCASLIALSLERDLSLLEAHEARLRAETEQLRSILLSSVSHDLRTPLAAIAGASSGLLSNSLPESSRRELIQSIVDESHRLNRLVENLLDMTRLQAGGVVLNKQWHVLEEIVGSARGRLRQDLARHDVAVALPPDLPLVHVDGVLLEQVFVNLLENAARYTPAGSRIEVAAWQRPGLVMIRVADNGPGLPPGAEQRVFDKFFRGTTSKTPDQRRGVGLGLAICRSILEAHGGKIEARNRPHGGVEFLITLPCRESPPKVVLDGESLSTPIATQP